MNKMLIAIISSIVIIIAIWGGIKIFGEQAESQIANQIEYQTELSEEIEDECTQEWEELNNETTADLQANTPEQIQLSPNCSFTFQTHYTACGHTSMQYNHIPQQLVNQTQEQIQTLYNDWEITTFTSNEVVLEKQMEGQCGEHYVLREVEGKIVIYVVGENGEEQEYEKTEIATDYLTETDKITIREGLKVYGKENLNQTIEDFE